MYRKRHTRQLAADGGGPTIDGKLNWVDIITSLMISGAGRIVQCSNGTACRFLDFVWLKVARAFLLPRLLIQKF